MGQSQVASSTRGHEGLEGNPGFAATAGIAHSECTGVPFGGCTSTGVVHRKEIGDVEGGEVAPEGLMSSLAVSVVLIILW